MASAPSNSERFVAVELEGCGSAGMSVEPLWITPECAAYGSDSSTPVFEGSAQPFKKISKTAGSGNPGGHLAGIRPPWQRGIQLEMLLQAHFGGNARRCGGESGPQSDGPGKKGAVCRNHKTGRPGRECC